MNFKYYLRGLGIGIFMTAIIMTLAHANDQSLSNEEIKARAKQLGMIEDTVLTEMGTEEATETETAEAETVETENSETESLDAEPTEAPTAAPTTKPVQTADNEDVAMGGRTQTVEKTESPDDIYTITINTGESSFAVCTKLEEAGLVAQASAFDSYLCQYGYDKKIRIGTYEIPIDADTETIANIITGTK